MKPQTPVQRARVQVNTLIDQVGNARGEAMFCNGRRTQLVYDSSAERAAYAKENGWWRRVSDLDDSLRKALKSFERAIRAEEKRRNGAKVGGAR